MKNIIMNVVFVAISLKKIHYQLYKTITNQYKLNQTSRGYVAPTLVYYYILAN